MAREERGEEIERDREKKHTRRDRQSDRQRQTPTPGRCTIYRSLLFTPPDLATILRNHPLPDDRDLDTALANYYTLQARYGISAPEMALGLISGQHSIRPLDTPLLYKLSKVSLEKQDIWNQCEWLDAYLARDDGEESLRLDACSAVAEAYYVVGIKVC